MADDCQNTATDDCSGVVTALDTAEAQELVDEDLERRRRYHRIGTHWKKPALKVYADNFGFGVNSYQCMIDYLDEKDCYGPNRKKERVHLPLLGERCLDSYNSKKPFKFYDNGDINAYIDKGNKIISQIRQNDVVSPGNVLNRTHTNWSMTKKYVQLVKDSHVIDYRKLRAQKDLEALGVISNKKPIGVTFGLNTMADMNLTLYKAHNNLDHAIYMNSRRERLAGIDHQFDDVVTQMSETADDLNRRAQRELRPRSRSQVITAYDKAQNMAELAHVTEDLAARNRIKRQLDYEALEEGVDQIMRLESSRNRIRNNLRSLSETAKSMEDEVSAMKRRHREERCDEYDISPIALRAQAQRKARLCLNLGVDDGDVDDPDMARYRMRKSHAYEPLDDPAVQPFHKYRSEPDVVSDVQSRVMHRAAEIRGQTSTQRHVNNRARYVNIYVPRHNTADPDLIVKPSRTELNIDHMAKSLAQKGRIQRRWDVDDEVDLPVSSLNTYAKSVYCNRDFNKPIAQVPSNSGRVRGAVIRARERVALQRL